MNLVESPLEFLHTEKQRNSSKYILSENETWQWNKRGMEDFNLLDKSTPKQTFSRDNN